MIRIFCTNCKPEYEMKYEEGKLQTHCPCTNVAVDWDIDLAGTGKPAKPYRMNSYESKKYRVETVK